MMQTPPPHTHGVSDHPGQQSSHLQEAAGHIPGPNASRGQGRPGLTGLQQGHTQGHSCLALLPSDGQ